MMRWTGASLGVVALGAACLSASCATVQSISARQTGCAPGEIQISEDSGGGRPRRWVAMCRGQRFRCAHVTGGESSCVPEQLPPAMPMPAQSTGVQRVAGVAPNGAPIAILVAELDAGPFHFHVEAAPSVDTASVHWTITGPVQLLGPACQAGVMIDGIINDFTILSVRADGSRAEYATTLPMVAVRAMAMGGRVVGQICGNEWRLDDLAASVIRQLVASIDQEAAPQQPPPTTGGEVPPPPPTGGEVPPPPPPQFQPGPP